MPVIFSHVLVYGVPLGVNFFKWANFLFAGVSILAGIKEGTYVDLCPTSCISPHLFYCQIVTVEHKGNLEQLMNQLQEYYDTISEQEGCISEPRIGMLCAAIYAGLVLFIAVLVDKRC